MRSLLMAAAIAVACGAATASASPTGVRWFHSPSGNIQCEVASGRLKLGTYAFCATRKPARCVRLTGKGQLSVHRGLSCEGDGPENATTLAYGSSLRTGPFRCTSRQTGMRCVIVVTGHGFLISRAGVKRV
jgi:hypothetical protein